MSAKCKTNYTPTIPSVAEPSSLIDSLPKKSVPVPPQPIGGGPAFPGVQGQYDSGNKTSHSLPGGGIAWDFHNQGMSLRDYFAGQALARLIPEDGLFSEGTEPIWKGATQTRSEARREEVLRAATDAYEIADAMLAAREKSNATA